MSGYGVMIIIAVLLLIFLGVRLMVKLWIARRKDYEVE